MDLSIVIVNYRAWDDLGRCLDSLEPIRDREEPSIEVLVVDNGSGDGRTARFRELYPWARLIESPVNGGFAYGCNLGAGEARGSELLFLNPDCLDPANIGLNLKFLMESRIDLAAVFENIDDPARMSRFVQGHQLLTESLYYRLNRDDRRSLQLLQTAAQVNPEDREFPFLIRLYR